MMPFMRGCARTSLAPLISSRAVSTANSQVVTLNYQKPPPPGKRTGRYIGCPDLGDTVDEYDPCDTIMLDARQMEEPACLESCGFALLPNPTAVVDFRDDAELESKYYGEMIELVKNASGADRVFIFDHTVRSSQAKSLNALEKGATAAAVPRVHCDYTATGAPRRLKQLAVDGIYSRLRDRVLSEQDVEKLASKRFAFINVWRNIVDTPVQVMPLAVCDTTSVPDSDHFLYELIFADRVGENYSLRFSEDHKWYYYPEMVKEECLVFKVFDQPTTGPRFVFHTAFEDPRTPADAPARQSIEIRAIAFYDVEE